MRLEEQPILDSMTKRPAGRVRVAFSISRTQAPWKQVTAQGESGRSSCRLRSRSTSRLWRERFMSFALRQITSQSG